MRATKTKRNAIFILSLGKARAGSPPSSVTALEGPARLRLTSWHLTQNARSGCCGRISKSTISELYAPS